MSTKRRSAKGAVERVAGATAAEAIRPLLDRFFPGGIPVLFRFWDGSTAGPEQSPGTVNVSSADALRRVLWAPGDLGLARAYAAGDLDVAGDLFAVVRDLNAACPDRRFRVADLWSALRSARRAGVLGLPLPPPPEEIRAHGWQHSKRRDARAISHHYDVGNDFYRLFLGPSMTYSCARFVDEGTTLDEAQAAKHELVCRKLGLADRPGSRLLDVGCGWGAMALHAAARYDCSVVAITISQAQAELARTRVAEAGLADRVEIRLQDYREVRGEHFDAISSIGMFEHVGCKRAALYFETLRAVLGPGGRLLNHAISSEGGSKITRRSFMGSFIFPDGELLDVGEVAMAMERAGFEVRDVESLREHYTRTCRSWGANLDAHWDKAVELAGTGRSRVWRLYLASSALGFFDGGVAVHQVLGVVPTADGQSGMPAVRTWA